MKIINLSDYSGSLAVAEIIYGKRLIYIGRAFGRYNGSSLSNPFKIGLDGTRKEVIEKYEKHIRHAIENKYPDIIKEFELINDDSVLACWCYPKKCHGEVLRKLFYEIKDC